MRKLKAPESYSVEQASSEQATSIGQRYAVLVKAYAKADGKEPIMETVFSLESAKALGRALSSASHVYACDDCKAEHPDALSLCSMGTYQCVGCGRTFSVTLVL